MSEEPNWEELCIWMYDFLVEHWGEDVIFFAILERHDRYDEIALIDGSEQDRAEIFRELITGLVGVLGSEKAAGEWLMHSAIFEQIGGAHPIDYLEPGGFWTLSLLNDVVKIALAHPTDPLGLRAEADLSGRGFEKDFETMLDLIPAAWNMDDDVFERILGVESGYLKSWRIHEVGVTEQIRQQLRRVLLFHETLGLHVRPRGYPEWWHRRWTETSPIGARTPLEVWENEGWEGLETIKSIFRGQ